MSIIMKIKFIFFKRLELSELFLLSIVFTHLRAFFFFLTEVYFLWKIISGNFLKPRIEVFLQRGFALASAERGHFKPYSLFRIFLF